MLSVKHYYPNLNDIITLRLASFVKDKFSVRILNKEPFNRNFQWIEFYENQSFSIASYDASEDLDTKLELFYYLYNLNLKFKCLINLSNDLNSYSEMFTVAVYADSSNKEQLFKFYLGLCKKDIRRLTFKNNFSINKHKILRSTKSITLVTNFSSLHLSIGQTLNLSYENLFIITKENIYSVKGFLASQDFFSIIVGEGMTDNISIGLELQNIEIGFQDFNKLNVGSELELARDDINEIVITVGEGRYALADVYFDENRISLKVKDLF